MKKSLARAISVLILVAAGVTISSPVAAQSPEPKVNIARWGNGRTTLAILFGTIIDGVIADSFSGTIGNLLTRTAVASDDDTRMDSHGSIADQTQDSVAGQGGSSTPAQVTPPPSGIPDSTKPAAVKVVQADPSKSSGSGGGFSARSFAIAGLMALGVMSLVGWKIRSTFLEKIANPTEPGPDDGDWTKPHPMNPEETAATKGGCNIVARIVGRVLVSHRKPSDLPSFDDPPTTSPKSAPDKKNGPGKDDPGDGFVEIKL